MILWFKIISHIKYSCFLSYGTYVHGIIKVVTKVHPRSYSPEKLVESITNSKNYIYQNTSRPLDVVLLHAPWCWRGHCTKEEESVGWQTAWSQLEALKDAEEVHAIGVSNFDQRNLKELLDISNKKVSVVHNWMDPYYQDRVVREMCKANGIVYM